MRPAFRSASTANCLPGILSNANLAATSETLPAPCVTTIKLTINKIKKIIIPTTKLPPTTNSPTECITLPA